MKKQVAAKIAKENKDENEVRKNTLKTLIPSTTLPLTYTLKQHTLNDDYPYQQYVNKWEHIDLVRLGIKKILKSRIYES